MEDIGDVHEHCVWNNGRRAILEGVRNKCAMIKTWRQALVTFLAVKRKIVRKAKMGERPGVKEKDFNEINLPV